MLATIPSPCSVSDVERIVERITEQGGPEDHRITRELVYIGERIAEYTGQPVCIGFDDARGFTMASNNSDLLLVVDADAYDALHYMRGYVQALADSR